MFGEVEYTHSLYFNMNVIKDVHISIHSLHGISKDNDHVFQKIRFL